MKIKDFNDIKMQGTTMKTNENADFVKWGGIYWLAEELWDSQGERLYVVSYEWLAACEEYPVQSC